VKTSYFACGWTTIVILSNLALPFRFNGINMNTVILKNGEYVAAKCNVM
jgi:hypothetical protein